MDNSPLMAAMLNSIAPATLISGAGLLLLNMCNRYGRLIDRTRSAEQEIIACQDPERLDGLIERFDMYFESARLIKSAIIFGAICVFFTSLTILLIFSTLVTGFLQAWLPGVTFVCGILSLCASAVQLIRDLALSMTAVKLEGAATIAVANVKKAKLAQEKRN